jgi:hypothetical protein
MQASRLTPAKEKDSTAAQKDFSSLRPQFIFLYNNLALRAVVDMDQHSLTKIGSPHSFDASEKIPATSSCRV